MGDLGVDRVHMARACGQEFWVAAIQTADGPVVGIAVPFSAVGLQNADQTVRPSYS